MNDQEQLQEIFGLLAEIIEGQQKKVRNCAHKILPHLTEDDLLQPNDFPELENHPHFRYEEGMLAGVYTVQMALQASFSDFIRSKKSESR